MQCSSVEVAPLRVLYYGESIKVVHLQKELLRDDTFLPSSLPLAITSSSGYWPRSVRTCGFWFPPPSNSDDVDAQVSRLHLFAASSC